MAVVVVATAAAEAAGVEATVVAAEAAEVVEAFAEIAVTTDADVNTDAVEPAMLLARMTTGTWVDLYSGGEWLRAQLVWSSQKASLFMFTSLGGRTHTMTRRSCEKLMAKRWLRLVETRPVMARALSQVVTAEAATEAQ